MQVSPIWARMTMYSCCNPVLRCISRYRQRCLCPSLLSVRLFFRFFFYRHKNCFVLVVYYVVANGCSCLPLVLLGTCRHRLLTFHILSSFVLLAGESFLLLQFVVHCFDLFFCHWAVIFIAFIAVSHTVCIFSGLSSTHFPLERGALHVLYFFLYEQTYIGFAVAILMTLCVPVIVNDILLAAGRLSLLFNSLSNV